MAQCRSTQRSLARRSRSQSKMQPPGQKVQMLFIQMYGFRWESQRRCGLSASQSFPPYKVTKEIMDNTLQVKGGISALSARIPRLKDQDWQSTE